MNALAYLPVLLGGIVIGFFIAAFLTRHERDELRREGDRLWKDLQRMTTDRDTWHEVARQSAQNLQAFYRERDRA